MTTPEKLLDSSPALELFKVSGISVAEWARQEGFSTGLVYQVLEGRRRCLRGQSHRIALALGLKAGLAMDIAELSKRLKGHAPLSASTEKGGNANA